MTQVYRNRFLTIGILAWLFVMALPFWAGAGEKTDNGSKFSIGLTTGILPFLSGDAGEGEGAPDYDDLFKTGYGIALEAEYRVCEHASLVGGIGYMEHSGKSHQGLHFDDLEIIPLYVGCKMHIPASCPVKPYIQIHIGTAHLSSVDVSWNSLSANYWDSSWVFMGDAGIGLDYQVNNWSFSAGLNLRYAGAPDNELTAADADGSWTIPVQLGISYSF